MDHNAYRERLAATLAGSETPFPATEYHKRRRALDAELDAAGLAGLLVTNPAQIHYLTGYNTFEVSVHTALAYTPGRTTLQVPSIETGPAVAGARCDEVIGYRWEDPRAVVDPLADALAAMDGPVGIDAWGGGLRHAVVTGLSERLGPSTLVDASGLVDRVRIVKSPAELECLRASARMTEAGIAAAAEAVGEGAQDSAIAAAAARAMHLAGSEFMSMQPIVVAGRRSSIIHTNHQRHAVRRGDPVFIELGAACQRYTAPLMHTAVAGTPTTAMQRTRDTARAVYEALVDAMRPKATFDEAARAGEAALAPLVDEVFFSGVFAYTVGAQFPPSWVEGSGFVARGEGATFAEDMVFHLPLCLRVPGEWGIGFSETVRITARGAEPITRNDWLLRGR